MDGILVIDKPAGPTSHDVVNRVRRVFGTRKVGHTGTLDPFATGVMTVLVGKATRLAKFIDKDVKEYEATIKFGLATETGDATGAPIGERMRDRFAASEIESVLDNFRGEILQTPPMYSAKKVAGKKLYELARRGEVIEREAVAVTVFDLELVPVHVSESDEHRIRVRCSAGTYIRTLAEDIAKALNSAAHLTELRRTASGKFSIEQSVTLDELAEDANPARHLLPLETAIEHLPRFTLNSERVERTLNGLASKTFGKIFDDGSPVALFSEDGKLIAIGEFAADEESIQPTLVLGRNE